VISAKHLHPFGMPMPERSLSLSNYRFGFNNQEKVDAISGAGNHNTALFWEYDPRIAKRWNLDPKPQFDVSSYSCFASNPISFVDLKGDTAVFKGNSSDVNKLTETFSKAYNANLKYDILKDKDGNVTGVKYYDLSSKSNDKKYDKMQSYFKSVLNSKETLNIKKFENTKKHIDEVEQYGGIMYKPKSNELIISDQWFTGEWQGSGLEKQPSYDYKHTDGYTSFRTIPFEEALMHEVVHVFRDFHGIVSEEMLEENVARYCVNLWLKDMDLPQRALRRPANFWEERCGFSEFQDLYKYPYEKK